MKQRIEWIDAYRGILILLVVLNHQSLQHTIINESFLAIRMPAFFFISGLLLSDRYTSLKVFASRRFYQLIIPYFIFYILNWIFSVVALTPEVQSIFETLAPLKSMLFGCVNTVGGQQNINAAPLWFITTLFMAEIYMFFVKSIFKTTTKIVIAITVLAFIGYLGSQYLTIRFPWNMEVALTALFFYGLGYIVKREKLTSYIMSENHLYLIGIFIASLGTAVMLSLQTQPSFDTNNLGSNIIVTYISAIFGITALLTLAQLINKNRILKFLGRNTYIILAFHLSGLYFMHGIFRRLGVNFESTMHSDIWGVIYLISSLLLLLPIRHIINKYAPFILNRK